ncbi:MAG: DUF938 domain-containing protein [Kangiellaceae bacterium]|nr:DUF938 domain-containing protein [Kangiellaceae bacterium]
MKQYSEACERNKEAIFEVLEPRLTNKTNLLEIGSGTGQHAVYFGEKLSHIQWQSSDRLENHPSITSWVDESNGNNILQPLNLDVTEFSWLANTYDAIYSANTAHIMPWDAVEHMFKGVGMTLREGGLFFLYGPFNYDGQFTSESNRSFEGWLKSVDPHRGIRDFEALDILAKTAQLKHLQDIEMPANNRIHIWQK